MSVNPHNSFVIQGFMVTDLGLAGDRLVAFAVIYGLAQASGSCRCPMDYLSDWIGKGRNATRRVLDSLAAEGLVRVSESAGRGYAYTLSKWVRERYAEGFDEAEAPDFEQGEFSSNRRSETIVENSGQAETNLQNRRSDRGAEKSSGGFKMNPGFKMNSPELCSGGSKMNPPELFSGVANKPAGENRCESPSPSMPEKKGKSFLHSTYKKEHARVKSKDKDKDRDKGESEGRRGEKSARGEGGRRDRDDPISREYFGLIRGHVANGDYYASGLDAYRALRADGHSAASIALALDEANAEISAQVGARPVRYWPQAKRLLSPDDPRGAAARLARRAASPRRDDDRLWMSALSGDLGRDLFLRACPVNDELVRLPRDERGGRRRRELMAERSRILEDARGGEGSGR